MDDQNLTPQIIKEELDRYVIGNAFYVNINENNVCKFR